MSGPIIYPSTGAAGRPQVFGGSANQFVPPLGQQTETFKAVGPPETPTVNTNVSSGGNVSDVFGAAGAVNPTQTPVGEFPSVGAPQTPTGDAASMLGRDVTDGAPAPFDTAGLESPQADQVEDLGHGPIPAPPPPFEFGSGTPRTPTTNDSQTV